MTYVAAFRAYFWNDDVAELARRFFAACPDGRWVVVADETRGALPIEGYEVISHTEDLSALGLPNYPEGKSLWYNIDYALYVLRRALPDYDYYVTCESDLAVNLNLEPMLAAAAARRLDIVGHELRKPDPGWFWYDNGKAVFDDLRAGLFVFTLVSARAVDLLLETRQRQAVAFAAGTLAEWPFCESFIPSVLQRAGMIFAAVSEFADTGLLGFRPRYALDDPRANRPGTIVHSVLGRNDLMKAEIKDQPPRDWFRPGSQLHKVLKEQPIEDFWPLLLERFAVVGDHAGYSEFRKWVAAHGIALAPLPDLAYCKPALVSSVSEWSRSKSAEVEATGVNGAVAHEDYGFHTMSEPNPWWSVDLLEDYVVDEIVIVNREIGQERFRMFAVQSSRDGNGWITRFIKMDLAEVSADPEAPHRIGFSDAFVARYVRILLMATGIFHLRRVRIMGRAIAAAA